MNDMRWAKESEEPRASQVLRRLGIESARAQFDTITRTTASALEVAQAAIIVRDSEERFVLSCHGGAPPSIPGEILDRTRIGEILIIEDTRLDPRFSDRPTAASALPIGFYAGCTLSGVAFPAIATLYVTDSRSRRFDARSSALLLGFAAFAEYALGEGARQREHVGAAHTRLLEPAAHQIRGALTSIHGFSDFLLNQDCGASERKEALGVIHEKAEELAQLLAELVDLFQLESSGSEFQYAENALTALLRESIASNGGRRSVIVKAAKDLPPIRADAKRLKQTLSNLLKFAENACEDGDIQLSVGLADEHGFLALTLENPMTQLDARDLGRLFEPFFRSHRAESRQGSIPGLAVSKTIIERHGGRIILTQDAGPRGVRITLLLPIIR